MNYKKLQITQPNHKMGQKNLKMQLLKRFNFLDNDYRKYINFSGVFRDGLLKIFWPSQ